MPAAMRPFGNSGKLFGFGMRDWEIDWFWLRDRNNFCGARFNYCAGLK
jgi:hypothetical protein